MWKQSRELLCAVTTLVILSADAYAEGGSYPRSEPVPLRLDDVYARGDVGRCIC